MGYTDNKAQLMTVPPYIVACASCVSTGFLTDKLQTRGVVMIGFNLVAIVGLVMLVASHNDHIKYAGTFFFATGVYTNTPLVMGWNANNCMPSTKRSVALAMQAMVGNFGGILSAYIYLSRNAPRFIQGHCINIGLLTLSIVICTLMTTYYRQENARRDRKFKPQAEYSAEEKALEREKGDGASFFRYTV